MSDENPICRICFDEEEIDNEFISPCSCKGSSKYVHKLCLHEWRHTNRNSDAWGKCMECNTKYILRHKYPLENENIFSGINSMFAIITVQYISGMLFAGILHYIESETNNHLSIKMLNLNKKLKKPNLVYFIEENTSLIPTIFYYSYSIFIQTNLLLIYFLYKVKKNINRRSVYFHKMKYDFLLVFFSNFQFIIYYYVFVWNNFTMFYVNVISFLSIFTPVTYYALIKKHNKLIIKMNLNNPEEVLSFTHNPLSNSDYQNYISDDVRPLRLLEFSRRNVIYPSSIQRRSPPVSP